MPKTRSFNADQKTQELLEGDVTIGGETFHPARLTPDVRREQVEIQVRNAKLIRDDRLDRDARELDEVTDEQLDKRVEGLEKLDQGLYDQLAVLLRDNSENRPAVAFLTEHLDQRVARELLDWLTETVEDAEGEPAAPTTPAATGS